MFGYDSITVSYALELISVSMCYLHGDGLNTSLSRLCTVHTCPAYLYDLCTECLGLCIVLGVVVGGMAMCYPERRK